MSPDPLPEDSELFVVDATEQAPSRDDQSVWPQLGWAAIIEPENQNMDLVPHQFDWQLSKGCEECGAAWQDLLALGFTAPRMDSGEASWNGHAFNVSTPSLQGLFIRGARVRCHSGHSFEFDWYSGLSRPYAAVSPWFAFAAAGMLCGYLVAALNATEGRH